MTDGVIVNRRLAVVIVWILVWTLCQWVMMSVADGLVEYGNMMYI